MSHRVTIRSSGRHHLSDIPATLADLIDSVYAENAGIEIQLTYGSLRAIRLKPGTAVVMVHGPGGGYCWERHWPKARLRRFVESNTPPDPLVRRGRPEEVWPR